MSLTYLLFSEYSSFYYFESQLVKALFHEVFCLVDFTILSKAPFFVKTKFDVFEYRVRL